MAFPTAVNSQITDAVAPSGGSKKKAATYGKPKKAKKSKPARKKK